MKSIGLNDVITVSIPNNWKIVDDGTIISFFQKKNGIGALQITLYTVTLDKEVDLVEMLFDLLEDKFKTINVKLIDKQAFAELTDESGVHWQHWLSKIDKYVIYVTYNCKVADIRIEKTIVDGIIKSIAG